MQNTVGLETYKTTIIQSSDRQSTSIATNLESCGCATATEQPPAVSDEMPPEASHSRDIVDEDGGIGGRAAAKLTNNKVGGSSTLKAASNKALPPITKVNIGKVDKM